MTKAQVVGITAKSARLVETNAVGIAPRNEKHARRLLELKQRAAARAALQQDNYAPCATAAGATG